MLKRTHFYILIVWLTFFLSACQDIQGPQKEIYNTWKVTGFTSVEERDYPQNEIGGTYLTILEDNNYILELDINMCSGSLISISERTILFDTPSCTEACCDSPFSQRFTDLLTSISMFKITGNTLRLSVHDWGFIECELVE